jgi:hypothetical protein
VVDNVLVAADDKVATALEKSAWQGLALVHFQFNLSRF